MILSAPIRLGGRLLADLLYFSIRFALPPVMYSTGFKRSVIGKCVIFAPPKQMQVILGGVTYLQTLDHKMFLRLTAERRYVFWYHKSLCLQCKEIFSITDNFILWGKEGVITCFMQCIFEFTSKSLPLEKTPDKNHEATVAKRRQIQQLVFEWLNKHSFAPELVKQYQEFLETYGLKQK